MLVPEVPLLFLSVAGVPKLPQAPDASALISTLDNILLLWMLELEILFACSTNYYFILFLESVSFSAIKLKNNKNKIQGVQPTVIVVV